MIGALRARVLITLSWSEFDIHGSERGHQVLAEALTIAEQSGDLGALALAHHQEGLLLARGGELDASLTRFDDAIAYSSEVGPDEVPAFFLNRGNVRLMLGLVGPAREDFRRCAQHARTEALTRVESKALSNLGYAEYVSGNLASALETLRRAHELDADVSLTGLLDRAHILTEAGLLDEAEEALGRVAMHLRRTRSNQERAEAHLARASVALMQERWSDARSFSGRARRDFHRRQSLVWEVKASLASWQAQLELRGGPARVVREVTRLRESADEVNGIGEDATVERQLALVAAEAELRLGHVAEAERLIADVPLRAADPLSARLHHRLVRAGIARATGRRGIARRELRAGLETLAAEQARHHSLDLRTARAVHGNRLARFDLRLALESGSPRTVFDSLERWRAMSHRRTPVTAPTDPELAGLLTTLRMLSEEIRTAPPGPATDQLRRRRRTAEQKVREREWALQGQGLTQRSTSVAELRPALADHATSILAHYVLDHRLGAVGVNGGRVTVHTLGPWNDVASLMARVRADLDALAGRLLPDPLRAAITASLRRDLARLDDLLLPPAFADAERLVVVPTRTLATAPWSLLPRRRGRPTTVSVSATSWLRGLADSGATAPRVIAMAGPGLSLAAREVGDVAALWPGAVAASGPQGSAGALARALGSHDLVHLAAHGLHNHDNPLFSSIRLVDGPLFAYDIPADAPVAAHIVLSSCDLGLTTPRPGGEVLGLTAALLGIGARSIVSAVSRVGDDPAYETMVRYHRLLATGLDSPSALAQADDGDLRRPAPFVAFGSPWTAGSAGTKDRAR